MIKAYVCSPLSDESKAGMRMNMLRARHYMRLIAGKYKYHTYAPHAYLPELLDDDCPEERALALSFGMELLKLCQKVIIFGERISAGMQKEIELAFQLGKEVFLCPDLDRLELFPIKDWRQLDEMQTQNKDLLQ